MSQPYIISGQYVRIGLHYAGLAPRFIALLADTLLVFCYFVGIQYFNRHIFHFTSYLNEWGIFFGLVVPALLYVPLCEVFNNGQTLGKRLMHIRVVRTDGTQPTLGCALLRFLLLSIDWLLSGALGAVLIALTRRHQRLGDMAAGTTVVSDRAFRASRVDLSAYDYLLRDYHPHYVQAAELSPGQALIIEHTLDSRGKRRATRLAALCEKVERVCGPRTDAATPPEQYLAQVLSDYRYYELQA